MYRSFTTKNMYSRKNKIIADVGFNIYNPIEPKKYQNIEFTEGK